MGELHQDRASRRIYTGPQAQAQRRRQARVRLRQGAPHDFRRTQQAANTRKSERRHGISQVLTREQACEIADKWPGPGYPQ